MTAPADLPPTLAEAAAALAAKTLSPVELTQSLLDRIDRLNPILHAYVEVTAERALADARAAEAALMAGHRIGPLHGIPIALKDIYDTGGIATTCHSHLLADNVPERDAVSVAKLRAAGTVLLGKLATHEFAFGGPSFDLPFPPARNPWDVERFTGGSSSGSGAAAAAGLALGTMGSDTAGSIRMPAHNCGIAGIKPTYGLVSRRGVAPLAYSLDHAGPMCRTVEDCAMLLQAVAGHDPGDPASAAVAVPDYRAALEGGVKGLRLGLVRHWYDGDDHASPAMKAAMDAAVQQFTDLGAIVEEVTLSPLQDYHACCFTLLLSEALAIHGDDLRSRPDTFGANVRARFTLAALVDGADYVQASRLRRILMAETRAAFASHDALITVGGWDVAPKIADVPEFAVLQRPLITAPFNVTGDPAVTVRCGMADGLPLSLQVATAPFRDDLALRIAHTYERSVPWSQHWPGL